MDDSNSSMSYQEAVKYVKKHGHITKTDMVNLESACDYDKLTNYLAAKVDKKYLEAVEVIKEHNIQEFLNKKLP